MSTASNALSSRFPPRSTATAGGTIGYREAPGEAPLVLLHGIGSGATSWVRQLEAFGGRFRVLAWDAPGYGESDPLPAAQPRRTTTRPACGSGWTRWASSGPWCWSASRSAA
jgi:pimeloyl-ACP methyl ester carboxylesterase